MPDRQYHLQISEDDVSGYVLLPGDPGRCSLIAERLEDAHLVAANREFTTWTGTLQGTAVSVTSTGIGGPSAAIAVEELSRLGVHTLLRVGTCGSMQRNVRKGDLVVATAAVRDEGTSRQYLPLAYPAIATPEIVRSMCDALRAGATPYHVGVVQSKDSFYGEMQPESMPVQDQLLESRRAWERSGVLASDMECAAIFIVAAVRRLRAGGILLCINEPPNAVTLAGLDAALLTGLIDRAIASLGLLIAADQAALSTRG